MSILINGLPLKLEDGDVVYANMKPNEIIGQHGPLYVIREGVLALFVE